MRLFFIEKKVTFVPSPPYFLSPSISVTHFEPPGCLFDSPVSQYEHFSGRLLWFSVQMKSCVPGPL